MIVLIKYRGEKVNNVKRVVALDLEKKYIGLGAWLLSSHAPPTTFRVTE